MIRKYFLVVFTLVFFYAQTHAQSRATMEDQGYDFLNNRDFVNAYLTFDKLHTKYPAEVDYHFKLGVCCLYYPEKKPRAIEIFKSLKASNPSSEVDLYLGKAYHMNYKFDEAIAVLTPVKETLIQSKRSEDKVMLDDLMITLKNCENGKTLMESKTDATIVNIGPPVNTYETEGVPIITADESMLIYTYIGKRSMGGKVNDEMESDPNGQYQADIFMSYKDSTGAWGKPQPVSALNTKRTDAAIAISSDGSQLFTFINNKKNVGDIQVSKLTGNKFSSPVPLNSNINTPDWEGSCSISADGRYLYFSSERPEGQGGKDLYVSEWTNGDWGFALNMGPKINTSQDEDAPFIHPDGITLFYSSQGHSSIGGYDIMFSHKEGNDWTEPKSMGMPVNTVEDDRYYVTNSKGDKGYFSSNRDVKDAQGEQDIYMVTPGINGDRPVVAILKGTVFGDDKPVGGKLEITKAVSNENLGPYEANNETGKYLAALSPGHLYKIKITAPGFETVEEEFDIERLSTYMEMPKDFYLYSSDAARVASVVDPAKKVALKESMANAATSSEPLSTNGLPAVAVPVVAATSEVVQNAVPDMEAETKTMAPVETKTTEPDPVDEPELTLTEKKKDTPKQPDVAKTEAKKEKKAKPVKTAQPEESEDKVVMSPCSDKMPDLEQLKGKSLNDTEKYRMMIDLMGEYCAEGLVFTVQIGAYKNPDKYKYKNLKDLGKVSSENYPDGITRFTQRQFNTLKEAEKQRQKAIAKGQKDAWIVAFVNGKRYTLEDLIMVDFMGKPIN